MPKTRTTISLDAELLKSAQKKIEKSPEMESVSQECRDHLAKIADMDIEKIDTPTLLEKSNLNDNQKEVVLALLEKKKKKINLRQFKAFVKSNGLYDRRDHIETAWKKVKNDDYVPYTPNGKEKGLEVQDIKCDCDAKFFATSLVNSDGKCPKCGDLLIEFDEEEGGPSVAS